MSVDERVFTVNNENAFHEINQKDTAFIKIICPACQGDGKADLLKNLSQNYGRKVKIIWQSIKKHKRIYFT